MFRMIIPLIIVFSLAGPGDAITLRADAAPQVGEDSLLISLRQDHVFSVDIYINNNDDYRYGYSLPLRFYSSDERITDITHFPNGSLGTYSSIELMNGFEDPDLWAGMNQFFEFSWDNSLPDSINHTTINHLEICGAWPNDWGERNYIKFYFTIAQVGMFCVDSTDFPGYTFDWYFEPPSGTFEGPYCWNVTWICGDVNNDGLINILDIDFLIKFKYKQDQYPYPPPYPWDSGDCNDDGDINILDIVKLINFKYKDQPPPDCPEP
jgi:hypothetical protein